MQRKTIDINVDMGEIPGGAELDAEFMPYISACNISCGLHAGDWNTIKKTMAYAIDYGLAIGAHPSYDDPMHFGRLSQDLSRDALRALLESQLDRFMKELDRLGGTLQHIKPHGALYHDITQNEMYWAVLRRLSESLDSKIKLYCLSGTRQENENIIVHECFADRRYEDATHLLPRTKKNAVLTDKYQVADQVLSLAQHGTVKNVDGIEMQLQVDSICFHSDTPGALSALKRSHQKLLDHDYKICPPSRTPI